MKPDPWLDPIKQPPSIYEEKGVTYQLEEERRLFYVALTRAETRLDVLTVQGAESVFVEELPDRLCEHLRPLPDDELDKIETDYECRRTVTGTVHSKFGEKYATFDWEGRGLIDLNLYDADEAQRRQLDELVENGRKVTLQNCGIQYRTPSNEDDADYKRLQLQLDTDVTVES